MTILRTLALNIATMVRQLASASGQEWAQATQHELQFIENDWSALLWALGSIRILFKRTTRTLADFADVPRAAHDLRRKLQRRTYAGYAVTVTEAVYFAWHCFTIPHFVQRTGCVLAAAAMLVWTYQLFSRRPGAVAEESTACVTVYRLELERQRDFFRGWWLWLRLGVIIPGLTLICAGGIASDPKGTQMHLGMAAAFVILITIAVPNSQRMANNFQNQIDRLDSVLKSDGSAG